MLQVTKLSRELGTRLSKFCMHIVHLKSTELYH